MNNKVKDLFSKGMSDKTLRFFKEQQTQFFNQLPGIQVLLLHEKPTSTIFPSIFKACSSSPKFLHLGLQLHSVSIKTGSDTELVTANSLLSMYAKCSHIDRARQMFDTMPVRDTVTWNSMITSYIRHGHFVEAMDMFTKMGFQPKPELIASVLSVCGRTGELRIGRQIHARIVCDGTMTDSSSTFVSTALVDMYSRCFHLLAAFHVFDQMVERDEVSWTAMIAGCIMNESFSMAIEFFRAMQTERIQPNRVTLITVLPACAVLNNLKYGKQIHGYAIRRGFNSESHFETALVDMYCKCGTTPSQASLVFERSEGKDVVMWTSMIGSYSQNGDIEGAMKLFYRMQMEGIRPNSVTLLAIITACTAKLSLIHGEVVHGYIVKSGLHLDGFVDNSLIDMYAKCGCLDASHKIFFEIPRTDSVSWSALIRGYGLNGRGREALKLFHEMQERRIEIDEIAFLAVLTACNHSGLIEEGQELFNSVRQNNSLTLTVEHYSCYIDILGRSGKIEEACKVISNMPMKSNPTTLSSLVSACKAYGSLEMAEVMANRLIDLEPDNAANYTLLCMIYAEMGNWHRAEEVRRCMRMRGLTKESAYSRIEPDNRVTE